MTRPPVLGVLQGTRDGQRGPFPRLALRPAAVPSQLALMQAIPHGAMNPRADQGPAPWLAPQLPAVYTYQVTAHVEMIHAG